MNILFAASECVPFIKTGGLADVVGALAPVLAKKGHDVRVILPKYGMIPEKYRDQLTHVLDFYVQMGWRSQYCGIEELHQDGVTFYFEDNEYYFFRNYIYGMGGDEYERFGFFCRAVLEALPRLGFHPDILHTHDWQSGMIPALMRIQYNWDEFFRTVRTVFTIHNLQYQGIFGVEDVKDVLNLDDEYFTDDKLECYGCANFMKAGLVYADEITTVSPSYAEEIKMPYYAEGLEGILNARHAQLSGIINGIDKEVFNPYHDPELPVHFDKGHRKGKALCKAALQEKMGLDIRPDVPIFAMVTRMTEQKGFDLVACVLDDLMSREDMQFMLLGTGDERFENFMRAAEYRYKGRLCSYIGYSEPLSHLVYAGSDFLIMPSRFEPCGLSQMIAMRYGTLPIVRETGGLKDTVLPYKQYTGEGNGFSFANYDAWELRDAMRKAMDCYRSEEIMNGLIRSAMDCDFGFDRSAEEYAKLYVWML